jgi:formimidoylglutamate deiminase
MERLRYFRFDGLLQQQRIIRPAFVGVDDGGVIRYISESAPTSAVALEIVSGVLLPGIPNAHSHAFQYAMAGMAERHLPGSDDDFWTWRENMYQCALSVGPEEIEAIATMLYAEMLRRGYTHVAEFHYLHHDQNGKPYNNLSETGERLLVAAEVAGIKITLIPVFYQRGGFGEESMPQQRRFISKNVDEYFYLLDSTITSVKKFAHAKVGFGVHSLRAVDANDVIETFNTGPRDLPFHLHAAEQQKEVSDCVAYLKQRPVEWLLNNLPLQERCNLVHCTHLSDDEVKRLAQTRANVVLCPGTEGNLGDGIFRLKDYAQSYGNWCIGTDSHISLNPFEDLRWLDYAQRLTTHKRNTFDDSATVFMNKVVPFGRRAAGIESANFFETGAPLDGVVIALEDFPSADHILQSIVYTADPLAIVGTLIDGKWVVRNHVHKSAPAIRKNYRAALNKISRR